MVHHFAINTVFTVSGEIVLGLTVALVVVLAIVAVASVVLSARAIVAPVVVLLSWLLTLLRFKCSHVLFWLERVLQIVRHGVYGGKLLVHLHSVVCEENLVGFLNCEPRLVLVR
jgi:hypothetical protein